MNQPTRPNVVIIEPATADFFISVVLKFKGGGDERRITILTDQQDNLEESAHLKISSSGIYCAMIGQDKFFECDVLVTPLSIGQTSSGYECVASHRSKIKRLVLIRDTPVNASASQDAHDEAINKWMALEPDDVLDSFDAKKLEAILIASESGRNSAITAALV